MMFLHPVEAAFARFQAKGDTRALAIVFDRTAPELLRLARHLAPNGSEAEDLVQATFLTAIEAAKSHQRGRPVLPWLAGMLANHARVLRRQQRRRPDPDRLRGDVLVDAARDSESNEVTAEVQRAIANLPEVYRPVLRLWLEHGLEAKAIAVTLERPAGTVRAQISRGLELLRKALPLSLAGAAAINAVAGRGLAAVRQHVLGTGAGTTTGIAANLTIGGLLVLNHKLMLAATLLAAVGLAFLSLPPTLVSPPEGSVREVEPAAIVSATIESRAPAADFPAGSHAVPDEPQRVAVAQPSAPVAAAAAIQTAGLVLKVCAATTGAPLANIGISLRRGSAATERPTSTFRATDQGGIVRFVDLECGYWAIDIDRVAEPRLVNLAAPQTRELMLTLPNAATVDGTVVDAFGAPARDAAIVLHGELFASSIVATSDAYGRFTVTGVTRCQLQAQKHGYAASLAQPVQGQAGQCLQVTLALGNGGRRIRGRVLDAAGKPMANCAVAIETKVEAPAPAGPDRQHPAPTWVATDAEGHFVMSDADAARYLLIACPAEQATPPACCEADTRIADAEVELRIPPPTVIDGHARRDGVGLPRLTILATTKQPTVDLGSLRARMTMRAVSTDHDGAFQICGAIPGELVLTAVDTTRTLGESQRTLATGGTTTWDVDLRAEQLPTHVLRGRLVDGTGRPCGGKFVWAAMVGSDLGVQAESQTAADGTFALGPLPAGEFRITTGNASCPSLAGTATLTLARDELVGDLVVAQ